MPIRTRVESSRPTITSRTGMTDQASELEPIICPFEIAIDTREQAPWPFLSIPATPSVVGPHRIKAGQSPPYLIQTRRLTLPTGDYSLVDHTRDVVIERKSKADLYQTLTRDRDRFIRELERMLSFQFAAIVVEAGWREVATDPPPESFKANPQSIIGSILAWQQRYPRIHWILADDRRTAEVLSFRLIERWWRENVDPIERAMKKKKKESSHG